MPELEGFDSKAPLSLIVGWRSGRTVQGRDLVIANAVEAELRKYAVESASKLDLPGGRDFDLDDEQGEAPFLRVPADELMDHVLIDTIRSGSSLPTASAQEARRLQFYAVLLGSTPEDRTIFVRRGSPIKLADKGLVALFNDALNKVTVPIFAFDPWFDVIVYKEKVWVLHQTNFKALFKDTETVLAKTSEWVDELSTVLPIEGASKAYLAERLRANSHLRNKVQAILKKPHIAKLTPSDLTDAMMKHNLDPGELMPNGSLVFTSSTEKDILFLLNEDFFKGDFSGDPYAASKKSPRS
jgi:hypothetical protein